VSEQQACGVCAYAWSDREKVLVGVALPGIKIGWGPAGGGCGISKVGGVLRVLGTLERIDAGCDTSHKNL